MKKLALALGALAGACGEEPPPPPPPIPVEIIAVTSRDVPVTAEFTGEIRGAEDVQVMARVAGFLQEQAYREGNMVRKDDLLFVIDPKPYEAAAAKAQADLAQAQAIGGESALASAEGIVASLHRQRTQKENELSVLLGRAPGSVSPGLSLAEQTFPAVIPAGLPSELLQRRADVRQAEEGLRAANAQIGAAIAALFPTISLTAGGGTASTDLGSLFSAGTGFWNLAANLFQPLINRGRNLKQVAAERARTEAAVAQYEKAVLNAFREVEDGLVGVQRLQEEAAAGQRSVEAARRTVVLATLRYEGGVDNYLNLLDAQRVLLDAELNTSSTVRRQKVAVVQLYKALGGGWDPVTDTLALPPTPEPQEKP
jgi:multidrug efflux system outer membrane protein